MAYSHIWDGALKLASFFGFIIGATSLNLERRIQVTGITPGQKNILLYAAVILVWLLFYRQYLSIISAWLYARVNLRANVSFSEARELRKLFQLDLSFKWLPLREIKALPRDQRHDAIMLALERMAPARKAMFL